MVMTPHRYLADPYLINGSKFDLRVYVYVSCYDPLKIYVFKEGLARFATCKYSSSMKHLSNRFMHLTNYRWVFTRPSFKHGGPHLAQAWWQNII